MMAREPFTFSELEQWLNKNHVTEIECLVPDLTGVARGKILPREKFTEDRGMRVPEDVSVVGFDDIQSAAFHNPSLTTVRQPLRKMGAIAATTLLERLQGKEDYPEQIAVEPELMVRESTRHAPVAEFTGASARARITG